jgi:hypothetical protein
LKIFRRFRASRRNKTATGGHVKSDTELITGLAQRAAALDSVASHSGVSTPGGPWVVRHLTRDMASQIARVARTPCRTRGRLLQGGIRRSLRPLQMTAKPAGRSTRRIATPIAAAQARDPAGAAGAFTRSRSAVSRAAGQLPLLADGHIKTSAIDRKSRVVDPGVEAAETGNGPVAAICNWPESLTSATAKSMSAPLPDNSCARA